MRTLLARTLAALDSGRVRSIAPIAAVVLIAVPLLGLVLVTLAGFVPDRPILDELVDGINANRIRAEFIPVSTSGRFMDTWTDCIGLTIGIGDDPAAARWTSGLRSPTLGNCGGAIPRILAWEEGEGLFRRHEYFRYWHGYAVILRPMIATVGIVGTRIITGWLLIGMIGGFGWSVARRHGLLVALALLAPIALTTDPLDLPASLPHAWGSIAAIGSAWGVYLALGRTATLGRAFVLTILAGSTFLFLDILTIPPGAWALSAFAVVLAASRRFAGRQLFAFAGVGTVGWITGWAWMWICKWIFAVPIYGFSAVREQITDQVTTRLDGDVGYIDLSLGGGVRWTWSRWIDHPLAPAVLISIVALVTAVLVVRWRRSAIEAQYRRLWVSRLALAAPMLLVPLWFEVVRNHTQVHGFTFRSVPYALGIIAASLIVELPRAESADNSQLANDRAMAEP
ncbi:MAG: hypothetical protein AAGA42_01215 [Actinomycetota bacterium]